MLVCVVVVLQLSADEKLSGTMSSVSLPEIKSGNQNVPHKKSRYNLLMICVFSSMEYCPNSSKTRMAHYFSVGSCKQTQYLCHCQNFIHDATVISNQTLELLRFFVDLSVCLCSWNDFIKGIQ
ncbi:hypothetical protein GOODEAATRI_013841 [Goodea atripinnis]|uniref:Uncharacterized protein n=1 Tax=Goodea atripinnis TaxID=208336 RepID=A0ABV0NBW9_9TELE